METFVALSVAQLRHKFVHLRQRVVTKLLKKLSVVHIRQRSV